MDSPPARSSCATSPAPPRGERAAIRDELEAELERRLLIPRTELLDLERGDSVKGAVAALEQQPDVAFAEPDFIYRLATLPDDPDLPSQWPLDNQGILGIEDADIDAPEAWSTVTGDPSVVVAVVDGGVAMEHDDLDDNIWANPGESGGLEANASDDDGNTKVDDHRGWDFVQNDNDPTDGENHGTHVAGTIGAEGNNGFGITGVAWDVSLMPLRACDMVGLCVSSHVADAFAYAGQMGADIVNASLSGSGFSQAQEAAIAIHSDTLFVAAAGNDGTDNDAVPRYPCNYAGANLICVGASTSHDTFASFSNRGANSVDLAAPGGGAPGTAVNSTSLVERMNQTFGEPLGPGWETGGTPDTWAQTDEPSELPGGTLTDSPGAGHGDNTNNFARYGPVDLSGETGCHLRYDLGLDLPDLDDQFIVEVSTDDLAYTTVQELTGVGEATMTPFIPTVSGSATAYVRFRLVTDGGGPGGNGAHVDNVRIRCPSSTGFRPMQGTSMAAPHVSGAARAAARSGPDGHRRRAPGMAAGRRRPQARARGQGRHERPPQPGPLAVGRPRRRHPAPPNHDRQHPADEPRSRLRRRSPSRRMSHPPSAAASTARPSAACPNAQLAANLAIGQHSFRVRAIDTAGNEDATPASYSFVVEQSTPPVDCAKLRKKLKKAKSKKQKRKLRKKIKKNCSKVGLSGRGRRARRPEGRRALARFALPARWRQRLGACLAGASA